MDIPALHERLDEDKAPVSGVQYAIRDANETIPYGDQTWIRYGAAIADGSHPDGVIVHRTVTVTYGPWVEGDHEAPQ